MQKRLKPFLVFARYKMSCAVSEFLSHLDTYSMCGKIGIRVSIFFNKGRHEGVMWRPRMSVSYERKQRCAVTAFETQWHQSVSEGSDWCLQCRADRKSVREMLQTQTLTLRTRLCARREHGSLHHHWEKKSMTKSNWMTIIMTMDCKHQMYGDICVERCLLI